MFVTHYNTTTVNVLLFVGTNFRGLCKMLLYEMKVHEFVESNTAGVKSIEMYLVGIVIFEYLVKHENHKK